MHDNDKWQIWWNVENKQENEEKKVNWTKNIEILYNTFRLSVESQFLREKKYCYRSFSYMLRRLTVFCLQIYFKCTWHLFIDLISCPKVFRLLYQRITCTIFTEIYIQRVMIWHSSAFCHIDSWQEIIIILILIFHKSGVWNV